MKEFLRRPVSRWLIAAVSTALMLLMVWAGDRTSQSLGGEGASMKQLHVVEMLFEDAADTAPADFLAVNIGYDRELVAINDDYGMPLGRIDVTDRAALAALLERLSHTRYKAIVLDVYLDPRFVSPADSAIYAAIERTPRLIVTTHTDVRQNPRIPREKLAVADYSTNFTENNFVKYSFIPSDTLPGVAVAAHRIKGGRAYVDGTLTEQPSLFLMLPVRMTEPYDADGEKIWYNLGVDILNDCPDEQLAALVDGRVIVIGDYTTSDFHDTYVGSLAGPVILINAIRALDAGAQRISLWSALLMALVFFAVNIFIATDKSLWQWFNYKPPRLLAIVTGMMSYTTVLLALSVVQYAVLGEFHDAYIITIWLTVYYFGCGRINKKFPVK